MARVTGPYTGATNATLWQGRLTIDIELPEPDIQTCVSRNGVLHLHRPGALASVCGRKDLRKITKFIHAPVSAMQVLVARKICPYCFAWAQRMRRP